MKLLIVWPVSILFGVLVLFVLDFPPLPFGAAVAVSGSLLPSFDWFLNEALILGVVCIILAVFLTPLGDGTCLLGWLIAIFMFQGFSHQVQVNGVDPRTKQRIKGRVAIDADAVEFMFKQARATFARPLGNSPRTLRESAEAWSRMTWALVKAVVVTAGVITVALLLK